MTRIDLYVMKPGTKCTLQYVAKDVDIVPRIGESLIVKRDKLRVTDVIHKMHCGKQKQIVILTEKTSDADPTDYTVSYTDDE